MRIDRSLVWVIACALSLGAACNSITGVNDLTFDRAGEGGASGTGSGQTGGTTSSTGGTVSDAGGANGTGGACVLRYSAGPVTTTECGNCAKNFCCEQVNNCESDVTCADCFTGGSACNKVGATTIALETCFAVSCNQQCLAMSSPTGGGGTTTMSTGGLGGDSSGTAAGGDSSGTGGAVDPGECFTEATHEDCVKCCKQIPGAAQAGAKLASCGCMAAAPGAMCEGVDGCGEPATCITKYTDFACQTCFAYSMCADTVCDGDNACEGLLSCLQSCAP